MVVFPCPISLEQLRARLYPFGRLRTSQAYQGAKRINWQAFFLAQERREVGALLLSMRRVTINPAPFLSIDHSHERIR